MTMKPVSPVRRLLAVAALLTASAAPGADGPLTLKGAPSISPASPVAGKDATVTLEVATSKDPAKAVQLQVRLGPKVIGALAGDSLAANRTGKFSVKVTLPADAAGPVTLSIFGQGLLIGNFTARVAAPAPVVALDNRPVAAAGLSAQKIETRAEQVRSLAVDPSVMAGSTAQATVTLEAPAGPVGTTVSLTSSSPAVSVPQSVRVPGGATAATFSAMAVAGGTPGIVTLSAVVAGPGGVSKLASLRVWGVEQVRLLAKSPGGCPMRGDGPGSARPLGAGDDCDLLVYLDGQTGGGGGRVNLTSSRSDVTVPASIAIEPNATQGFFRARVAPGAGGGSATITAVADRPGGVPKQLVLSLADPPAGQVTGLVGFSVVEPGLTYNGSVILDGPAGPAGVSVDLISSSAAVTVPPRVAIAPGAASGAFTARISPTAPPGDVRLTAARTGPGNPVVTLLAKVQVIEVAEVKFDSEPNGKGLLFLAASTPGSVTLAARPIIDVTVALSSSNVGASVPASVTIPAGQTSARFSVSATPAAQPGDATISAVRSGPGHVSKEKGLRIKVNQVSQVFFNPPEVRWQSRAGDPSHSAAPIATPGTVRLEAPAAGGGVTVALSADTSLTGVSVPASVFVAEGQSRANFTATVGTELKLGGDSGGWSTAPVAAVRSGQPPSEARTGNLRIQWNWTR